MTYVGRKEHMKKARGVSHVNPVFTLVERSGQARSFHMPRVQGRDIGPVLARHAAKASKLYTDEAPVFTQHGWQYAEHEIVTHSKDEYVRGPVHTNTVEGFFSILKRGLHGVYQHVSEAHLHRYVHEFDFRYSNREKVGVDDATRTARAVKASKGKRLTYETTVGS